MKPKIIAAVLFVLAVSVLGIANAPDQPYMQAARTDLQKARAALQRAQHNKGGHRANAIELIGSAILEVNRGMAYDRGNPGHHAVRVRGVKEAVLDQPNMRAALDHLNSAKRNLQSATADKGGHRKNAIDLVNRAIDEVNRGIAAAN